MNPLQRLYRINRSLESAVKATPQPMTKLDRAAHAARQAEIREKIRSLYGKTPPSLGPRPRLFSSSIEFARGDFVNRSNHFPKVPLGTRLSLTSATFRPASSIDRARKRLHSATMGKVALGPRDLLAQKIRRSRSVTQGLAHLLGKLG